MPDKRLRRGLDDLSRGVEALDGFYTDFGF